jgi:hypothetical protein
MGMKLRLALLLMLLGGAIAGTRSATAAPDDDRAIGPAWTTVDSWGNWGDYLYEDKATAPGVKCRNHGTVVDMTLVAPWPYANSDYYFQPVSLYWDLFKRNSNGSYTYFKSSTTRVLTAYDDSPAYFSDITFYDLPIGPTYVGVARLSWLNGSGGVVGYHDARYDYYMTYVNGATWGVTDACKSPYHPAVNLSPTSGTVNSTAGFSVSSFPTNTTIGVRWDGTLLGTIPTNSSGKASGSFRIPAAPMGAHKVRFSVGSIGTERTFTVIPRIKVIPGTASRGQTVNVSLRGFAKKETVRIRWKKGSTWVEVGRVITSNTGSANIDVKVPSWVPDGPTSVRGDSLNAAGGRAQTNAVTVSGGTYHASDVTKTPTPTPVATSKATATPSPSATIAPTQTPEATVTAVPSTPVDTATPETPTAEPTVEAPQPSATETPADEATETPPVETPTAAPEA